MEIFMKRYRLGFLLCLQVLNVDALSKAFFAPLDNLTMLFIERVAAERKSIHGAIYMLTDKKIAQSFIDAKKRGVDVQIIIDQASMSSYGKGKLLQENGVPVYVHRTQEFNPYSTPLMHHKFFVFGLNQEDTSFVWTGSWNCTLRGTQHNNENVILLDDQCVVQQYLDSFFSLKDKLMH